MISTVVLKNCTLIDGTGNPPQDQRTLVIQNGRIASLGDEGHWVAPPEELVTTLDLTGRYVLPGLIDCHVHLAGNGAPDSRLQGEVGWATLLMLTHAQKSLAAGITTVRDVGGRHGLEFAVRQALDEGMWAGPRMQLAGKLLSITSAVTEYYEGMYHEADGMEEVRKATREQLKAGADLIKVMAAGAVLTPDEIPGAVQFGLDELRVAVEEANKVGKPVAAGVKTVEHGTYLHQDARVIETMAERGIFLVPTLKAGFDVLQGERPGVPAWIQEKLKYVQDDAIRSVQAAVQGAFPLRWGPMPLRPITFMGTMPWNWSGCVRPDSHRCRPSSPRPPMRHGHWDGRAVWEPWKWGKWPTFSSSRKIRWKISRYLPINARSILL